MLASTIECCEFCFFAAIGPAAVAIAEGAGGGDEPSTLKGPTTMACKRSGADKMIDFMKMFVSSVHSCAKQQTLTQTA